jgi:DNA-binding PadR family transcriptional regulator
MSDLSKELIAATSTSMILSILQHGENYGYEIIKRASELSEGHVEYAEGTLYPILKKMLERNWITAAWKTAPSGRKRKYYRITAAGEQALADDIDQWLIVMGILKKLWTKS